MEIILKWENPTHFLLSPVLNKRGIELTLYEVKPEKRDSWTDEKNWLPILKKQTPDFQSGTALMINSIPDLLIFSFKIKYEDNNFKEILLIINQLFEFDGNVFTPIAWIPKLDEDATQLSVALPRIFNLSRMGLHPLLKQSVINTTKQWNLEIDTLFLDITNLWWKAIERNSSGEKEQIFWSWYSDHITETGSTISVMASTAKIAPLIWFVIIPKACSYVSNNDRSELFSQVYYRPAGWKPEANWQNNINDIIRRDAKGNIFITLLWCLMNPVKVLEQANYSKELLSLSPTPPDLTPITDRFQMMPSNATFKLNLLLDCPQGMASSVNNSNTRQLVFLPIRHANMRRGSEPLQNATEPNLHLRLKTAVNLLWSMNHINKYSTEKLKYNEEFVVAGYSLGGFSMWDATKKNIDKIKAVIAIEPSGIAYSKPELKKIIDSLLQLKRKIFFVGRYKTYGDMGSLWSGQPVNGITYLPESNVYIDFFSYKPFTTTNEWLKYIFAGLKKRDNEKFPENNKNPEPHPEPDISLEERKAINKLNLIVDADFQRVISVGGWDGIPILHLFAMCGGRIFIPPKLDIHGIIIEDAKYETFYQECMKLL